MAEGREVTYLVLVNSKSGGQDGPQLLEKFREMASQPPPQGLKGEVVSLTDPRPDGTGVLGPGPGLQKFKGTRNLRVIACGGDGTVGWVLSEIDNVIWSEHGKPPIAIIPLGTGNDLSRSLYWGGRYKDKPIQKVLHDVEMANIEPMDRWKLDLTATNDGEKHSKARDDIPPQIRVFNNYFSLGIDAHIALQFHNARNANSDKFTSRTRNLLFYGLEGGKDLVVHKWRHLMDNVKIVCTLLDGSRVDLTEQLRNYGAHALLFLNIRSYSGGARPWKQKSGAQSANDGLVEVIAMDNVDLALLNIGGTGESVCQAKKVEIETSRAVPMQVDGEPLLVNPFKMNIEFFNSADMLTKKKTSYPYRDPEVEEWAARKIQSSFKTYKNQKSINSTSSARVGQLS
eukprot:TRINITY_DN13516_c0_g1_i1.p1 TRINITY_DN13516_c0_g1~~TRINITY_DN13516_c0_g1_i1.p1  ORF type:complete len:399 (+),score=94.60 TRINITY_DN13516_c0_g1_i1:67-1263(+)